MGFLFEGVDLFLFLADVAVFFLDFFEVLGDGLFEFFGLLVLLVDLVLLVLDLAVELVDVGLDVLQFVRGQLQLSFGFKTHITDLRLVILVLILNVLYLIRRVLLNLLNNLLVFLNNAQNFPFLLIDLILLDLHLLAVSFCLCGHFSFMFCLQTI